MIGLPLLYGLGACALATVYMTTYANSELSSALIYGVRWPVVVLQASGII